MGSVLAGVFWGRPWRTIPSDKELNCLQYIQDFSPDQVNLHIRVMLYGPVGAGKSSFINTMDSALRGRITGQALPDGIGSTSFTTRVRPFDFHSNYSPAHPARWILKKYDSKHKKVKKRDGTYYPFVFTDLAGLENMDGVREEDIRLALQGHMREGYEFKQYEGLSTESEFYNGFPTIYEKTHVLVCVVPATSVESLQSNMMRKMRNVRLAARDLGIPQMAIITKIDEACREVSSDLKNVYRSEIIKQKVIYLSTSLGIPQNFIFPVKNYRTEIQMVQDINKLTLMALKQILDFGEDFVDDQI